MKVLFVYKGVGKNKTNSVIDAQANSLIKKGIEIVLFPLKTNGIQSYILEYKRLNQHLLSNKYDLIHAHYSYSGFISALTFKSKTVCSLMGSDIYDQPFVMSWLTKMHYAFLWKKTIVKSHKMHQKYKKSIIIPNGVDLDAFNAINLNEANRQSKMDHRYINVIFVAESIDSRVKNYALAREAIHRLKLSKVKFIRVTGLRQNQLMYYYNSASLLLFTSITEGSPNVIKEAMACNCPIVATDVGDVRWIIGDTHGCYVSSHDPDEIAEKLKLAIKFAREVGKTTGRNRIIELGLDTETIANKIHDVYRRATGK